jgi:hypothetical protein
MTCPRCKLENPPGATVCDCGYLLSGVAAPSLDQLDAIERHLRVIRNVLVAWFVLMIAGAVIYGVWLGVVAGRVGSLK